MYGYLDASADTNWIRVTPVREQLFLSDSEALDAVVTLEDLETGETTVMSDSLFQYGDVFAHNFWTTMELKPAHRYRITAKGPDADSSYAIVELPDDFPTPLASVRPPGLDGFDQIYIEGVENLADVRSFHHMLHSASGIERFFPFTHLQDTSSSSENWDYRIVIDNSTFCDFFINYYMAWNPSFSQACSYATVKSKHRQLFIASAGPDWHHFATIDENVIALPDGVSHVENGVGYVAGIVSKTIPYESCFDESLNLAPCPLEKPMREP